MARACSLMIVPLKHLRVINFRGIRDALLKLHPEVTVLFGGNAAGKTTILDALAIVLGAVIARVPKAVGRDFRKSGDIRVPWKDLALPDKGNVERRGVECTLSLLIVAAVPGPNWAASHLRSKQDRARLRDILRETNAKALQEALDPLILEALNAPPGELTRPIPFVAAYSNERALVDVPLRERGFNKELTRFGGLDHALSATTRFKTVFEWFRIMEDEERRARDKHQDFSYKLPALEWVRRAVDRAGLRCKNPRVETSPLRMIVDFEHENGETEPLDVSALSDGYRTHFALVVDMARRMVQLNPSPDLADPERGTNTASVVLIDEVDLHLDPPWQARVVQGLLAAFPRTQFVVTTRSERVAASVAPDRVRRLVWENGAILLN